MRLLWATLYYIHYPHHILSCSNIPFPYSLQSSLSLPHFICRYIFSFSLSLSLSPLPIFSFLLYPLPSFPYFFSKNQESLLPPFIPLSPPLPSLSLLIDQIKDNKKETQKRTSKV
uniref:Uncharacterized protein n=1 Tax=Cacopsylla melanoneura TaxID=428564 RepID=A0A8D8Q3Z7_9HEMI